jgi:AcrR family transcriptional regulator
MESPRSTRPMLSPQYIAAHRRRRVFDALAELVVERGYGAVTVGDIVRRAQVARNTFYEEFSSKEGCYLAAFDSAVKAAIDAIAKRSAGLDGDPRKRLEAGLAAFLRCAAERPALAQMCLVEPLAMTPASGRRYEAAIRRFAAFARRNLPHAERLPETTPEMLIGGVASVVERRLRRGKPKRLERLAPQLAQFLLTPYEDSAQTQAP